MYHKMLPALVIVLFFAFTLPAFAGETPSPLTFNLNDKPYPLKSLYAPKGDTLTALELPAPGPTGDFHERFKNTYVSIDDPDLSGLFKAVGAIHSWSSTGDTLFIFSRGRNIYFDMGSSWCNYRGQEKGTGRGYIKRESSTYVPISEVITFVGMAVEEKEGKYCFELTPIVDDLQWKEDLGTREFLIHSTGPVRYRVEGSGPRHITLSFPDARCTLQTGESWIVDGKVKVEDCPGEEGSKGKRISFNYPSNWEGKLMMERISGDIVIEMLPRFPLTPGYSSESLNKMEVNAIQKGMTLDLEASGSMQYMWSYRRDQRLLIIDLPLLQISKDVPRPVIDNQYVKELKAYSFEKSYGDTRIYLTIGEGSGFSFHTDEKTPHKLQIAIVAGQEVSGEGDQGVTSVPENWGTIVLDPGHGGCDPGAVNQSLGLLEKDINLDVCHRLADILGRAGWKVVLTHTTDRDVSWAYSPDRVELQARVDVGVANSAVIFISIHCNASTNHVERGSSLHWCNDKDLALAYALAETTEYFDNNLGIPQRGLCQNNFYVVRHSPMPALLVEMAHISNYDEALLFSNPAYRQKLAEGIARGIEKYFLQQGYRKK